MCPSVVLITFFSRTGISAVIHVASPFTGDVKDPKKDMMDPAIEGTLNVVRSAHKAGIQRIIVTSSFVAVFDLAIGGAALWLLQDHTEKLLSFRSIAGLHIH